jgi:hypothetical protein
MTSWPSYMCELRDQKIALMIVIRLLSDDELVHEAKAERRKSHLAQGMADRLEREIKRRKRVAKMPLATSVAT